jgi:hypothetical protein
VKSTDDESPPPGIGLRTSTLKVLSWTVAVPSSCCKAPAAVVSAGSIWQVILVLLIKVVVFSFPSKTIFDPETKPLPWAVRVNVGRCDTDVPGESDVTTGIGFWFSILQQFNSKTIIKPPHKAHNFFIVLPPLSKRGRRPQPKRGLDLLNPTPIAKKIVFFVHFFEVLAKIYFNWNLS